MADDGEHRRLQPDLQVLPELVDQQIPLRHDALRRGHAGAFHPDWRMSDRPPTPPTTVARARQIAMLNGIRYAHTGTVHDPAGQSTFCHECGALLIGRDWHEVTAWNLSSDGRCRKCGTPCAGVFTG